MQNQEKIKQLRQFIYIIFVNNLLYIQKLFRLYILLYIFYMIKWSCIINANKIYLMLRKGK